MGWRYGAQSVQHADISHRRNTGVDPVRPVGPAHKFSTAEEKHACVSGVMEKLTTVFVWIEIEATD